MKKSKIILAFFLFGFVGALALDVEMVGPLSRQEILGGNPEWQAVVTSYAPATEAIARLKAVDYPVEVEVVLGTWCPDSKAHVSEFFKVLDLADNSLIIPSYIGVPRDKAARQPYIAGKNVEKVPTFILKVNGQEKGRIVETPARSVEQDLVDILSR